MNSFTPKPTTPQLAQLVKLGRPSSRFITQRKKSSLAAGFQVVPRKSCDNTKSAALSPSGHMALTQKRSSVNSLGISFTKKRLPSLSKCLKNSILPGRAKLIQQAYLNADVSERPGAQTRH